MEDEKNLPEDLPGEIPQEPSLPYESVQSSESSEPIEATSIPVLPKNPSLPPTKLAEEKSPSPELQTAPMEPHHHPHVHHSKKWKDYLFEFIMLFLAVTLGFLVENQREHYIENLRAKQFSKSLLADLRLDSLLFENRSRDLQVKQDGHDKLFNVLTQKPGASDKEILEALLPISYVSDLPVTTTTYNQMKASGSLRYVHDANLSAALQNYYDVLLPRCNKLTEAAIAYYSQYINNFYLDHIRIQDYAPFDDSLINKNPLIINRTSQTNQQLANIMGGFRNLLRIQSVTMNDPALKKIKEIIPLLKEEYNLD